jgi:hypothetical protein
MDYDESARLKSVDDVVRETKKYANRLQTQDIVSYRAKSYFYMFNF